MNSASNVGTTVIESHTVSGKRGFPDDAGLQLACLNCSLALLCLGNAGNALQQCLQCRTVFLFNNPHGGLTEASPKPLGDWWGVIVERVPHVCPCAAHLELCKRHEWISKSLEISGALEKRVSGGFIP